MVGAPPPVLSPAAPTRAVGCCCEGPTLCGLSLLAKPTRLWMAALHSPIFFTAGGNSRSSDARTSASSGMDDMERRAEREVFLLPTDQVVALSGTCDLVLLSPV